MQLHRIKFRPAPSLGFDSLTENGKEIYRELEARYGFEPCPYHARDCAEVAH